jgi:hypothetical protein
MNIKFHSEQLMSRTLLMLSGLALLGMLTACNSMQSKGAGGAAFVPGSVPRLTHLNWKIVTPTKNFYVDDAYAPVFQRFFTGLLRARGIEIHGQALANVEASRWYEETAASAVTIHYERAPRLLIKYVIGNHQGICVNATYQADLYPADKDQAVWSIREVSCSTEPDVLAQRIYGRMKQDKLI